MEVRFKVEGLSALRRTFRKQPELVGEALGAGIYALGNNIMTTSKPITPKDFGILRGSGFVTLPDTEAREIEVVVGFGGPAKEYAEPQHENETWRHEEGEAKYLEKALDAHRADGPRLVAAIVGQSIRRQQAVSTESFRAHPTDPESGAQN